MHRGPLFVDSDNALGSPSGDVDDGIALAALLRSGVEIEALASVFGNTSAALAQRNTDALARICGYTHTCLAGAAGRAAPLSDAARRLADATNGWTVLALGPLSNVAQALALDAGLGARVRELVCLGSNLTSRGRWPPLWPFEFNFTKDRAATRRVFESVARITVVPLDRARRLRLRYAELERIEGELGRYLRLHARRWFRRARWLKLQSTLPVWDLVAVMYLLRPDRFRVEPRRARAHASGWIEYGAGERSVSVVVDFDAATVWADALALLNHQP
jgi:inosine-uridine nucleoside N-ribohydrolase